MQFLLSCCIFDLQQVADEDERELQHLEICGESVFLGYFEVVSDVHDQVGQHFVFHEGLFILDQRLPDFVLLGFG